MDEVGKVFERRVQRFGVKYIIGNFFLGDDGKVEISYE